MTAITPKDAAVRLLDDIQNALSKGGTSPEAKVQVLRELGELCASRAATESFVVAAVPLKKIKIKAYGTVENPPFKEQPND